MLIQFLFIGLVDVPLPWRADWAMGTTVNRSDRAHPFRGPGNDTRSGSSHF